jgi:magnesium chelatase subunit I
VGTVFTGYFANADLRQVTEWFDLGGTLPLADNTSAQELIATTRDVQGLLELAARTGVTPGSDAAALASAIDFVLEGLYAQKKISRSDARGYHGSEPVRRPQPQQSRTAVLTEDDEEESPGPRKKKYYN